MISLGEKMHCYVCNKRLKEAPGCYAIIWGPADQPATLIGYACIPCSEGEQFQDITKEVTGRE